MNKLFLKTILQRDPMRTSYETSRRQSTLVASSGHPSLLHNSAKGFPSSSYWWAYGALLLWTILIAQVSVLTCIPQEHRTYKGPVDESAIAARNRDSGAGNSKWASTLPPPADLIYARQIRYQLSVQVWNGGITHLTPYSHLQIRFFRSALYDHIRK